MNIYVGNLAYDVTETQLRNLFSSFGEVAAVNIIKEKPSGQSKGFGFVDMPNNSESIASSRTSPGSLKPGSSRLNL